MPKIPRKLKIEQIDYVASSLRTRRLPLSVYKDIMLEWKWTSSQTAGTPTFDEWLRIITKISIVLNGQDTLVSVPFYFLYYMNLYEFGAAPYTVYTATATATKVNRCAVILPFALLNAVSPQDTLLDARRLSSCVLEVSFGATPADYTNVVAYLQIDSHEYSNVATEGPAANFARHEYAWDQIGLDKTGNIDVKLEVLSNNQYRRLWLFVWDDATPTARQDGYLSNIIVKSRSFHFYDQEADSVQFRNQLEYGLVDPASGTWNPVAAGTHAGYATGVYVLDFPTFGLMSQRADARELSEFILQVTSTVNAADIMDIIKEKAIFA